jgi:hypothetical protein
MKAENKTVVKVIENIFKKHNGADVIYEDEKGVFWLSESTAKAQSKKTGMVTKHKKSDYLTKKTIKNGNTKDNS